MNPVTQPQFGLQAMAGGIPPVQQNEWRQYYGYTTGAIALAAMSGSTQGTAQPQILFQNQAPFVVMMITASAYTTATPPAIVTSPPVTLQITDQQSNRTLFSNSVNLAECSGLGYQPFVLPIPYTFVPSASVIFSLSSSFNAALNIAVTLHGFQRFVKGQQ